MHIRDETPGDAPLLDRMITETFLTARVAGGREAEVVRRLRADGQLWLSLVAPRITPKDDLRCHTALSV
jgi:Predicted acetyltransferase